jgi:rieske iron-sulfur protein
VCSCCVSSTRRQTLIAAGLGLGLAALPADAQSDPARERPQPGDLLVPAESTDRTPLTPQSLPLGGPPLLAWPCDPTTKLVRDGSRLNHILLLRLDPETLNAATAQRATGGVVAYSSICPHTGCEVTAWHADTQILECPCHNSQYDPKAGARVIAGPSPRSLAALPLSMADGNLSVAQLFIGKLGIQQM